MKKIIKVILSNKLKINKVGKCVYVKNTYKCYVIVYIYVDDMLILSSNDHMIKSNKKISIKQVWHKKLRYCRCHTMNNISWMSDWLILF
jgi:hypothetical protein